MRPGNFYTWATELNYSAGINPWNGQPLKVIPAVDYFTPGVAIAAEDMNYVLAQFGGQDAALLSLTGTQDGQNWTQFGVWTGWGSLGVVAVYPHISWTSAFGHWLGALNIGGVSWQAYQSTDGVNWQAFGNLVSVNETPTLFHTDAATGTIIAFNANGGGSFNTRTYNAATGNWGSSVTGPTGTTNATQPQVFTFNGETVYAQTKPSGYPPALAYSSNLAATWTSTASTLPTNFGANAADSPFLTAVGATVACIFSPVVNDTHYLTSIDGISWTTQTMPTLNTGEAVVGAGCDKTNSVFYIVVSTGSASRVFTSATGTSGWSVAKAFGYQATGFAAQGSELAMLLNVNSLWRMMISVDGGVTWGFARMTTPAGTPGTVSACGNGFIYQDTTNYALTHQMGPPTPLTI